MAVSMILTRPGSTLSHPPTAEMKSADSEAAGGRCCVHDGSESWQQQQQKQQQLRVSTARIGEKISSVSRGHLKSAVAVARDAWAALVHTLSQTPQFTRVKVYMLSC
jgi:hypothetical protein